MENKPFLVGGKWRSSAGGASFEVRHSWTGEAVAQVSIASRDDAEDALAAASNAATEMRGVPRFERADALHKIARALGERREEFARTIAIEAGRPIAQARGEASSSLNCSVAVHKRI